MSSSGLPRSFYFWFTHTWWLTGAVTYRRGSTVTSWRSIPSSASYLSPLVSFCTHEMALIMPTFRCPKSEITYNFKAHIKCPINRSSMMSYFIDVKSHLQWWLNYNGSWRSKLKTPKEQCVSLDISFSKQGWLVFSQFPHLPGPGSPQKGTLHRNWKFILSTYLEIVHSDGRGWNTYNERQTNCSKRTQTVLILKG